MVRPSLSQHTLHEGPTVRRDATNDDTFGQGSGCGARAISLVWDAR